MKPRIILASSSKARSEILTHLHIPFTVHVSNFEEDMTRQKNETFPDVAMRLALGKAKDVAKQYDDALVIGADTFVVFNDIVLGKPHTHEKAIQDLTMLQGNIHIMHTGMTIIDTTNKKTITDVASAQVKFKTLTPDEITQYVTKEDVRNAGGSYMISRLGGTLIEEIEGDYYVIVGLSSSKLYTMFHSLGYSFFDYVIKH